MYLSHSYPHKSFIHKVINSIETLPSRAHLTQLTLPGSNQLGSATTKMACTTYSTMCERCKSHYTKLRKRGRQAATLEYEAGTYPMVFKCKALVKTVTDAPTIEGVEVVLKEVKKRLRSTTRRSKRETTGCLAAVIMNWRETSWPFTRTSLLTSLVRLTRTMMRGSGLLITFRLRSSVSSPGTCRMETRIQELTRQSIYSGRIGRQCIRGTITIYVKHGLSFSWKWMAQCRLSLPGKNDPLNCAIHSVSGPFKMYGSWMSANFYLVGLMEYWWIAFMSSVQYINVFYVPL